MPPGHPEVLSSGLVEMRRHSGLINVLLLQLLVSQAKAVFSWTLLVLSVFIFKVSMQIFQLEKNIRKRRLPSAAL